MDGCGVEIRDERETDRDGLREVHGRAFPTLAEADLVDRLRAEHAVCASVVATLADPDTWGIHDPVSGPVGVTGAAHLPSASCARVIGHALFSRARLEFAAGVLDVGALGPVAVLPEQQRRGIGVALIRAGLERCRALHLPAVIVLGHPEYYPRFGFQRADTWAIRCEFEAPAEAFMIAWLSAPVTGPGVAKYHPAFSAL